MKWIPILNGKVMLTCELLIATMDQLGFTELSRFLIPLLIIGHIAFIHTRKSLFLVSSVSSRPVSSRPVSSRPVRPVLSSILLFTLKRIMKCAYITVTVIDDWTNASIAPCQDGHSSKQRSNRTLLWRRVTYCRHVGLNNAYLIS